MERDDYYEQIIEEVCGIVALAYRSIGDFSHASDGFCARCRAEHPRWTFQHQRFSLAYVRQAVVEKLQRDGYPIAKGFNPQTGEEERNNGTFGLFRSGGQADS